MRWTAIAGLMVLSTMLAAASPNALAQTPQAVDCGPDGASGRVLVRPMSPSGKALAGLLVVDPANGKELGKLNLPAVDAAFPTALPDRAVAIAGSQLYIVDAAKLTATPVPLGGDSAQDLAPNPVQFRGTAGTRYLLLGSPSFDHAYLIDAKAGTATSLTELIPPAAPEAPVFIPFAAITPDDAHVLMWDGQHVYVVATDNPVEARKVDTGAFAFASDYSPDGTEIIYSRSGGPGSGSTLVLESIDGANPRELKSSEHAMVTLWVPQSRTILVDERTEQGAAAGSAYLLDLASGDETPLLQYGGSLTTVQFKADGTHALLGVEMIGGGSWHLADLASGVVHEVPQLDGSRVLPGLYADARWALAVPLSDSTDPLSGPAYRGIDLETGRIASLLGQRDGMIFMKQPVLSPDGRLSLVTGQSDMRQETLWLLDAVEIHATKLADGSSVSALFSPDACYAAVTVETSIDGIPSYGVSVVPTNADQGSEISKGEALVWVED